MKYLNVEGDDIESFSRYFQGPLEPLKHRVIVGEMGMCIHDIPCMICFERSGLMENGVIQPCRQCQGDGFKMVKLNKFWKWRWYFGNTNRFR